MRNQDGFSSLFFAPLPNFEELIAVEAVIGAGKGDEISAIQPKYCRELIFTEPKVLLSPLLDDRNKLFLITQEMTFHSSEFQELLKRLNIKETERVDLTKGLFQFCFSFTMKQKLAPLWNKAGEFLVQGRDFMLEKSKLNTVSLEVTISDKISIGLQAYSLKSSPCMPEHFTASTRALEEFNTNEEAVITDAAISDDLCFVLPSLKKGRIFSITHHLPEECPFASYEDLRKHWKRMYGYRLPAEENVFYNVHFYYIRGKIFTYPASCIRSSQAIVSPRCDHQLIFNSFLGDLSSRMPFICGTPLALTSAPLYPTSRLQLATSANHSNLTRTAPQMNHCRPFTVHQQPECELSRQAVSVSPFSSRAASSQIHQTESDGLVSRRIIPSLIPTSLRDTAHNCPVPSYLSSETPFVPRFTSKHVVNTEHSRSSTRNSNSPSTPATRVVPSFSCGNDSKMKTTTATSRVCALGKTGQSEGASSFFSSLPPPSIVRLVRVENVSHLHKQSQQSSTQNPRSISMGQDIGLSESHGISSNFNRKLTTESNLVTLPAAVHINNADVTCSDSTPVPVSKCLPQKRPGLVITQAPSTKDYLSTPFTGNVAPKQIYNRSVNPLLGDVLESESPFPALVRDHPSSIQSLQQRGIIGQSQSILDLTLGVQVEDFPREEPPAKKLKSKPKIQDNIDVRELALEDQLKKVNAVTLADWLKKRGVAVKSKDKKTELTSKVKLYLATVPHEH